MNATAKPGELNNYVWLEFTLFLKRNHAFYVNHMIFPFAILSSLSDYSTFIHKNILTFFVYKFFY